MEFSTRRYSDSFIEITVQGHGAILTEDVSNLNSQVPLDLINQLRQVADELEDFNLSQ